MSKIKTALFYSIKTVMFSQTYPLPELSPEELEKLYQFAKMHDLAHLVAIALESSSYPFPDEKTKLKWIQEKNTAIARYTYQEYALAEIEAEFANSQITYLPLKGAVLRENYPEPWYRTSSDIDLFIHEEDFEKARERLTACGFEMKSHGKKDSVFSRDDFVCLELHTSLLSTNEKVELLNSENIWSRIETNDYKSKMQDADFYVYHVEHMKKHFVYGGCGIRSFLDLWLLNHKNVNDDIFQKRQERLEECGLKKFEEGIRQLSEVWFGDRSHNQLTKQMEKYIFVGGIYGTVENWAKIQIIQNDSKIKSLWKRTWLSYEELSERYPTLKKYPYLQPYYEGKRLVTMLFERRLGRIMNEANANRKFDKEKRNQMQEMLDALGIKENQK